MSKLWRCLLCADMNDPDRYWGLDFEDTDPKCPRCKAGPNAVIPRVFVHFLFPATDGPIGGMAGRRFRAACKPEYTNRNLGEHFRASGEPGAVTCPACKATRDYDSFKDAISLE